MRFKNLDLNLLVALDTLIRVRSVSRAAEEMFITQSAMSNALGRLRDYFDDALLTQVGRSMELSPLAMSLEQPLRDIIVRIEAAVVSAPSFEPEDSTRNFSFVLSDYTMLAIMPAFLQRLTSRAPGIRIEFKPQQIYPHLLLERGEADLLIAPTTFCSTSHPMEPLYEEKFCCVVDSDAPFPDGQISEADFLSARHVMMCPPNGGDSFTQRAFERIGVKVRIDVMTYSFSSLPFLVKGTSRIAVIQRSLAKVLEKSGGIRIVELPFALPKMEQSLQWHDSRKRDPALAWIREQVREAVRSLALGEVIEQASPATA
ncbi:LysR family transcriptional regulator [Agrobacterium sp. lyk4-40-TYG-31]|uniref:LysR family transcriptional regulator n=1 Tax=Agrobacterium sp. lyk4-40-TYG-31 TaxID=3040276 RepID=UPI00254B6A9E|nr:LysR family transcriptional regulator [Agrobacterium sp. lyk4-40-TYG-31]